MCILLDMLLQRAADILIHRLSWDVTGYCLILLRQWKLNLRYLTSHSLHDSLLLVFKKLLDSYELFVKSCIQILDFLIRLF